MPGFYQDELDRLLSLEEAVGVTTSQKTFVFARSHVRTQNTHQTLSPKRMHVSQGRTGRHSRRTLANRNLGPFVSVPCLAKTSKTRSPDRRKRAG